MRRLSHTTARKLAAGLALVIGIFGLLTSVPTVWRGAASITQAGNTPPYFVFVLSLILSPIAIIGAFGTWRNARWGIVLLLLTAAVDVVSAVPGILFGPTSSVRLLAASGTLLDTLVIVLCLWPDRSTAAS